MKFTKITVLAAVAVMACGVFYGCGEEPVGGSTPSSQTGTSQGGQQQADIVGVWKTTEIAPFVGEPMSMADFLKEQMGSSVDTDSDAFQKAASSLEFSYNFKEDGTCTQDSKVGSTQKSTNGTYQVKGSQVAVLLEGSSAATQMKYDAEAGTLSIPNYDAKINIVLRK